MQLVRPIVLVLASCFLASPTSLPAQASVFSRACAGFGYHCYVCHDLYWALTIRASGALSTGSAFFVETDDYTDPTPIPSLLPPPCNAQSWPRGPFSCYAPGQVAYLLAVSPSTHSVFVPPLLTGVSLTCHSLVPLDVLFLHAAQWSPNPISQRFDVPVSPSFTGVALHFQYWLVATRPWSGTRLVASDGLRVVLQ